MRLFLVRHPQPQAVQGLCYGASDVVCSAQAMDEAATYLLRVLPKGLPLISSPLSRCEQLAQILCGLQPDFSYKTDENLAEMNFGTWELRAWHCIAQTELSAWTDAFASYRCGITGQSTGQFVQAVAKRLYESVCSQQDQIWITHAGVIRAVQWLSLQPWECLTSLPSQADPEAYLSELRAADWPRGELAWSQVLQWDWPPAWPPLTG